MLTKNNRFVTHRGHFVTHRGHFDKIKCGDRCQLDDFDYICRKNYKHYNYYTLNATTDEAATVTGNALVAVTAPTHVEPADGDFTNFMLKSGEFIKIAQDAESVKMPANKAYLQIATSAISGSQAISLVWDEDTTGITQHPSPITQHPTPNTQYFTLDGQCVEHPAHGFFIIRTENGSKKVFIK